METTETVNEYKGKANLPESIRRQLEEQKVEGPINMEATRGNFAEDVLKEINKYRKIHGVEALKLSSEVRSFSGDFRNVPLLSAEGIVNRKRRIEFFFEKSTKPNPTFFQS